MMFLLATLNVVYVLNPKLEAIFVDSQDAPLDEKAKGCRVEEEASKG